MTTSTTTKSHLALSYACQGQCYAFLPLVPRVGLAEGRA